MISSDLNFYPTLSFFTFTLCSVLIFGCLKRLISKGGVASPTELQVMASLWSLVILVLSESKFLLPARKAEGPKGGGSRDCRWPRVISVQVISIDSSSSFSDSFLYQLHSVLMLIQWIFKISDTAFLFYIATSKIFKFLCLLIIAALVSLSDNSNIWVILDLSSVDCLFPCRGV